MTIVLRGRISAAASSVLRERLKDTPAPLRSKIAMLIQSLEGRTPGEIAAALGCAVSTLRRALKRFWDGYESARVKWVEEEMELERLRLQRPWEALERRKARGPEEQVLVNAGLQAVLRPRGRPPDARRTQRIRNAIATLLKEEPALTRARLRDVLRRRYGIDMGLRQLDRYRKSPELPAKQRRGFQ
jgi:transposase